jgi:hypothetical protein
MKYTVRTGPLAGFIAMALVAGSAGWAQEPGWHETFEDGWGARWEQRRMASRASQFLASTYDGDAVLRVQADRSAGALIRQVDGAGVPERVSWRWLLDRPLQPDPDAAVPETERAGDDYAARVFVIFGDDLGAENTRALCYVWAREQAPGTTFPSPFADRVQMIVLRSGPESDRAWRGEQIDPGADYRRAFGSAPPPVRAIGLMSDTDDTDSTAAVLFDDIVVSPPGRNLPPLRTPLPY